MVRNNQLIEIIRSMSDRIIEEKDYLTELDRPIGDSDHGINMARGFAEVKRKLAVVADSDIEMILKTVGMTLVSTVGGASGPLYGTAFMKASRVMQGKWEMSLEDFLAVMDEAVEGVKQRGKSTVGEKTMLDAMVPAVEAMKQAHVSGETVKGILEAGCRGAEAGMVHTKEIVATKGRASYLGDRSLGHQDPGATSFTFMLMAAASMI